MECHDGELTIIEIGVIVYIGGAAGFVFFFRCLQPLLSFFENGKCVLFDPLRVVGNCVCVCLPAREERINCFDKLPN